MRIDGDQSDMRNLIIAPQTKAGTKATLTAVAAKHKILTA